MTSQSKLCRRSVNLRDTDFRIRVFFTVCLIGTILAGREENEFYDGADIEISFFYGGGFWCRRGDGVLP